MYKGYECLDPGFWTKTSLIQLGYGAWASLTQLGIGLALGFQTVSTANNLSLNLDVKFSSEDGSWLGFYIYCKCCLQTSNSRTSVVWDGPLLDGATIYERLRAAAECVKHRALWRSIGKAYVQQWTNVLTQNIARRRARVSVLHKDTIPIRGPLDLQDTSVMSLATPIGCLVSGSVTDKHGRRIALLLSQMPMCIGWFFIAFASKPMDIILGRIIMGIGCGMATFPPRIYAAEISLPNMRGMVGSLADVAIAIGITVQIIIGQYLSWKTMSVICGAYAIGVFIINIYIPETPYYMLLIGDTRELRRNLAKFRSSDYKFDEEMDELLEFKAENNIYRLPVTEKILVLFRRTSCQPLGIITVYFILAKLSGIDIVTVWAIEMLTSAHSSVDPQEGNMYLAVTRLIVSSLTSMLLYVVGRRPMALISALGVTVICLTLGTFLHLKLSPNVVPEIFFIMYIIFASLGYYTMPQLMMAELYPLQIRGFMSGVSTSLVYLVSFGILKFYPHVKESMGFANYIFLFGAFSLMCTVFLYFFFPETKTLLLQDIEEYYNNLRPTLVSQRSVKLIQLSRSKTTDINSLRTFNKNKSSSNTNLKLSRAKLHNESSRTKASNLESVSDESPYITSSSNSDSVFNRRSAANSKSDSGTTQKRDQD